jgi:hypothetical protein
VSNYFSDRELGAWARTEQTMSSVAWAGIAVLVEALANSGAFGASFPQKCPDGHAVFGNDTDMLKSAIEAEIAGLSWPPQRNKVDEDDVMRTRKPWAPPTLVALDFIEFVWRSVARPIPGQVHDYYRHRHLTFDSAEGRSGFVTDVNRILARNGLAYEITESGEVRRILPAIIGNLLARAYFRTGDQLLDAMLEEARRKFTDPDPLIRREALERLFDSWERIKTLDDENKAKSAKLVLDRASPEPVFRQLLEKEALELRKIGNTYLLRHHERSQTPVIDTDHVDYLFHRLFSLVDLVIRKNVPR